MGSLRQVQVECVDVSLSADKDSHRLTVRSQAVKPVTSQAATLGLSPPNYLFGLASLYRDRLFGGGEIYWSLEYSALACLRMGMSGSASFHEVKKS
jgi:hypothetical protein